MNSILSVGPQLVPRTVKTPKTKNIQYEPSALDGAGGAIFVDSGSQSNITACNFTLNTAGQSGGAVAQADSVSLVAGSVFSSNSGSTQGGALFQSNMTGSVTACRFVNNTGMTGVMLYPPTPPTPRALPLLPDLCWGAVHEGSTHGVVQRVYAIYGIAQSCVGSRL